MSITVYLASAEGNDPLLKEKVIELGKWIGENGNTLVYGGSNCGLMGIIADTVLKAGGKVLGIEPKFFVDACVQHTGITKLIVTKDMAERKKLLIDNGDAFITFPGGTGTLEEVSEVMSKLALDHLDAPCIIYNLNGYYDSLKALLNHMKEKGLSSDKKQEGIYFVDNLEGIVEVLKKYNQM